MKATKEVADALGRLRREGRVTERAAGAVEGAPAVRRQWTITVPLWHPARLNELLGVHWGTANRRKKADREIIALYAQRAGVPKATGKRRVTLKIVLAKGQRGGDTDCYFKSLLDAASAAGLITDDNRQGCELAPVEYERAAKKATVITLEEMET